MNEENTNTKKEETMELTPAPENQETATSKGGSTLTKVAIVGEAGAITGAVAFGLKKLKERNEKKTIEKLKKKGWKIEEPETDEEELDEFETEVEDLNIDEPEEESK